MKNEYIPYTVTIESIRRESFDTKTFKVEFKDKEIAKSFQYKPGQFAQVSLLGIGEAPISLASTPSRKGYLEFSIRAMGKLTREIHKLKTGSLLYIRGPYGNPFPFEEIKGKNIYFIAGGIGLPPLRSLINMVFDQREEFGEVKILYGAKTPDELCFKEELKKWAELPEIEVLTTVDKPDQDWKGNVGVVTKLWEKTKIAPDNGVAFVCGPPVMIKFVIAKLVEGAFGENSIYVTLERYMKCGIGKCGHCNIGEKFVCIDGPAFTYSQIKNFLV